MTCHLDYSHISDAVMFLLCVFSIIIFTSNVLMTFSLSYYGIRSINVVQIFNDITVARCNPIFHSNIFFSKFSILEKPSGFSLSCQLQSSIFKCISSTFLKTLLYCPFTLIKFSHLFSLWLISCVLVALSTSLRLNDSYQIYIFMKCKIFTH